MDIQIFLEEGLNFWYAPDVAIGSALKDIILSSKETIENDLESRFVKIWHNRLLLFFVLKCSLFAVLFVVGEIGQNCCTPAFFALDRINGLHLSDRAYLSHKKILFCVLLCY